MSQPVKKSPAPALMLAFLPATLALAIGMTSGQSGPPRGVLWAVCVVSVASCFTSSFLLFRRKTGWAIAVGILFLLLNAAISFFVGCVALLQGMKF
ncbi:MAG TPA: hypothetical protein VN887_13255 [Candidatus Angelobacter sp.]|nr:hypothetical protein [Candidatus Angelobacter sp.]